MMGEFHLHVLKTVGFTQRRLQRPAPTKYITLDARVVISERRMRDYLRDLETMGKVCRPAGPKSGWALAAA
ncbi:MAG: hypothetical protein RIC84_08730 [Aggregatilineales bacterium]